METKNEDKKLGTFGWIVVGVLAIFLWPITLIYLTYLLGRFIYNKYLYDPVGILDEYVTDFEASIEKITSIVEEKNSESHKEVFTEVIAKQKQVVQNIGKLKVRNKYKKQALREVSQYLSDYHDATKNLYRECSENGWPDLKMLQGNKFYIEMNEIEKVIESYLDIK